jgi:large subunit ribosomal protein L25
MKELVINGTPREAGGKKLANQLRKQSFVPCNLYGGTEHTYFYAHVNDFKKLVYSPDVHQVTLNLGDKSFKAYMHEIQFHPVTDKILHVDFMEFTEDKLMKMEIPVKINGSAPGVLQGGRLVQKLRKLRVKALPKDMPDSVEVDVSTLNIGQSVRVNQVQLPGVELLNTSTGVIVGVQTTRVVVEETKEKPAATTTAAAPAATPAATSAADKKAEKPAAKK